MQNITPAIVNRLQKELSALVRKPPEGIKHVPREDEGEDTLAEVHADIKGPTGTP